MNKNDLIAAVANATNLSKNGAAEAVDAVFASITRALKKKDKVLNKIRATRGGKLNDPNFGSRMQGQGIFAEQIHQMFEVACRKAGLKDEPRKLTTEHFRRPGGMQMDLEL